MIEIVSDCTAEIIAAAYPIVPYQHPEVAVAIAIPIAIAVAIATCCALKYCSEAYDL
eukprot:COSAG06_NODE_6808_length_2767_cov_63.616567_2_plen_57_part_00